MLPTANERVFQGISSKTVLFNDPVPTRAVHLIECDAAALLAANEAEFITKANESIHGDRMQKLRTRFVGDSGPKWYGGVSSLAEAEKLFAEGWPAGTAKALTLAENLRDLVPQSFAPRKRLRWGDDGDEISMERVYAGTLDLAWRRAVKTPAPAPRTLSIDIPWGANAFTTADQLFWQGVAAIVLSDLLEDAGYRVELYASLYSAYSTAKFRHDGEVYTSCYSLQRIRIKDAQEPLRIDTLSFVAAHACCYRVWGINQVACCPWYVDFGWGNVRPVKELERILTNLAEHSFINASDIVLPSAENQKDALNAITKAFAQLTADPAHAHL